MRHRLSFSPLCLVFLAGIFAAGFFPGLLEAAPPQDPSAGPPVTANSEGLGSTATIPVSEPKPRKNRPCDPLMVSGITNQCAGTGDPLGFSGEAEKAGLSEHPLALELSDLPKDRYGLIDWATAIKEEKISPLDSLDPTEKSKPAMNLDVAIFTKSEFMPDVIFPHYVHTLWLNCVNCHPSIFPMNAEKANEMMTMPKISSGEFCGKCHNRVAFPLSDCMRCHTKPKSVPPIDPNYKHIIQQTKAKR